MAIGRLPRHAYDPRVLPKVGVPTALENMVPYEYVTSRGRFSAIPITVTTTSTQFVDYDEKRIYLMIQNRGANDIFVNFGNQSTTSFVSIPPGGNYEFYIIPIDDIHLVAAADTAAVIVKGTQILEARK